jgi:RHS repeat-associated protein
MQLEANYDSGQSFVHSCALSTSHFTGKERDTESGLDYFGARYYGSSMGRFSSPDPSMASMHFQNPQSLNRYAYVLNNPLILVDPKGMDCVYAGSDAAHSSVISGDCLSDDDDGVFVDGHVNSLSDNSNGSITAHWSDYTAATNPYDRSGLFQTPDGMAGNPMAQALFHGAGSPYWGGANSMATAGVAFGLGAPAAAFFAPEIAATYSLAAGSLDVGMFGPAAGRFFWSGGIAAGMAAADMAEESGGMTLEMTPAGQWLGSVAPNSQLLWGAASRAFASGATGPVTAVQGDFIRMQSVWTTIEYPLLYGKNPINYVSGGNW